jgi:hypothetical protein
MTYTVNITFDLLLLVFVLANSAGIALYFAFLKRRSHRAKRELARVTGTIKQFFHETGGDVTFDCVRNLAGTGYVVLIDTSSTNKRFRHSHLAELILTDYVRQKIQVELKSVYWRFPIKAPPDEALATDEAATAEHIAEDIDEYLREGLLRMKDLPVYDVGETSLEKFQEIARSKPGTGKLAAAAVGPSVLPPGNVRAGHFGASAAGD